MWPKHGCVFEHNYAYFATLVDLDIYIVLRWKGRNLCDENMQGDKNMQVIKESIMENKFRYVALLVSIFDMILAPASLLSWTEQ